MVARELFKMHHKSGSGAKVQQIIPMDRKNLAIDHFIDEQAPLNIERISAIREKLDSSDEGHMTIICTLDEL